MSRGESATAAGSFGATSDTTLSSLVAGANANTIVHLSIPGTTDYNFSSVINGVPSGAFIAPGPGNPGFVAGTHPALGEVMGTLTSSSTLGLTGNPCNSPIPAGFTFLTATVDITDTINPVPQAFTNPGSGGTLDNQWSDDGSSTTGPGATAPWNAAWPGMDAGESTNRLPAQVDEYPSYLNIIFDPDYPLTPGTNAVQPLARYAGAFPVVGTSVTLNLVVFAPGVLAGAGFGAGHPFTNTSTIGYTSIAVLNDTTVEASHGSISDFCTPLDTNATTYGVSKLNPCNPLTVPAASCDSAAEISNPTPGANSKVRYANPAAGVNTWTTQHESLRDADQDGIENSLDPCPQNPQLAAAVYNPRTDTGPDNDNDGLPDVCDPYDTDNNTDYDGDGWENSYDNCPLVSNPTQVDAEINTAYTTTAPGGGPRGDSIGDACDFNDNQMTGDGYSAILEAGTPLCVESPAKNDDDKVGAGLVADDAAFNDGCPAAGAAEAICGAAVDDDADGYVNDGCPQVGAHSEATFKIGTNANVRCGVGNEGAGLPSLAWPSDLYSGGVPLSTDKINVLDLTSFIAPAATAKLNTAPGQANFNSRWDLSPGRGVLNSFINVTDLTSLIAANPAGYPPMFGGVTDFADGKGAVKAFAGPVCTDPNSSILSDGQFLTSATNSAHTITP